MREMLPLAAAAADLRFHGYREGPGYFNCYCSKTGNTDDWFIWDPAENDGDALRLAVAALNWPRGGRAFEMAVSTLAAVNLLPADPARATRFAILYAAAEIGRAWTKNEAKR